MLASLRARSHPLSSASSAADISATAASNPAISVTGSSLTPALADAGITIGGNETIAVTRGNAADNVLGLSGTSASNPADVTVGRFDATVHAAAALLNGQANYGAVRATATTAGYGVPLNATGNIDASSVSVAGNSVSANAYGNVASNAVTFTSLGRLPSAAVTNIQANAGPVSAQVTGGSYRIGAGSLSASTLAITGNQLAATAVGNQASSTIAATR